MHKSCTIHTYLDVIVKERCTYILVIANYKFDMNRPTLFISYSWDSEDHREWVLNLANDLISKYGITVHLDQYELSAGKDLTYFMESSIEQSNKVLIILTPNYKTKAENRSGGVGFEYSMISQELFEIQSNNDKFIPILRSGNLKQSCPKYIKSKIYHDMLKDTEYNKQLFELSRLIYDKLKVKKPELGPIPDFESDEYDPFLEEAKEISKSERINKELNEILESKEGINLANSEVDKIRQLIKDKAELYSSNSDLDFHIQKTNRTLLILSCNGYSVQIHWKQAFINTLRDSKLRLSFWQGYLALNSSSAMYFPGDEPKEQANMELNFDLDLGRNSTWRLKDNSELKTNEIVEASFSYIINEIKKEKEKIFRKK